MGDPNNRDEELRAFASQLQLNLSNLALLDRALTHASALGDNPELPGNYESLEFLGDAVLGLAVSQWLYEHVPDLAPGHYTQMRARVVNKRALARVARGAEIAPYIRLGKGEEAVGGRTRPGLLADCLEAVIGATFLEAGWHAARDFAVRLVEDELESASKRDREWDFRSQLQNYCQANQWPLPEFEVARETGPDHEKTFEVTVRIRGEIVARGRGKSKKEAEQNAAEAALDIEGQR